MDDHHFSYIKFLKKKKGKNKNKNPKDLWTYLSAMLTRSRDNNQPWGWGPKSGSKFLRPTYRERWGLLFLTTKTNNLQSGLQVIHNRAANTKKTLQLVQERLEKTIFPVG